MNQPSTPSRRDILVCERLGDYLLIAFDRPELDSPADGLTLTHSKTGHTPASWELEGTS